MRQFSICKLFVPALLIGAIPVLAAPQTSSTASGSDPQTIGLTGALPDLKTVEVDSGHVYDYTFSTAPTDWWVQSGVWEMTNRWSCSPGWSWFGGRSDDIAAIWNKRKFSGDMSIHCYFAFKMGLSGSRSWHEYPSDMALSFNADGKNLGSGYTLIIGADNNQHSVLLRGDKQVAESRKPEALLTSFVDAAPNINDVHRRWWYVRIDKIGNRVECRLDNKLLFSYDDPKPLDAGQIALWTYNNGIMLARVQVFYENEQHGFYNPAKTLDISTPATPSNAPQNAPLKVAERTDNSGARH